MPEKNKGTNAAAVIGVVLIAFGAWYLARMLFGSWMNVLADVMQTVASYGWPLLLIVIGVLVLKSSQSGNLSFAGKRLYRSRTDRKWAGVIGGLAKFFALDSTVLRLVVILALFLGQGIPILIAYIVAMIVIPEEPVSDTWYS